MVFWYFGIGIGIGIEIEIEIEIGILGFREWDWDWEGKPHQVPTPLEAPEDVDLGTSFSLTNLLTKLRNGILGLANWLYLSKATPSGSH